MARAVVAIALVGLGLWLLLVLPNDTYAFKPLVAGLCFAAAILTVWHRQARTGR